MLTLVLGGIFIGKWKEFSSQLPLWHDTPCPTCELGLVLLCKARFFSCFVAIKAPSSDKSAFTLQKTPRKWNPFRDDTTLLAIQVVSSSTFIIVLTLQRDWRNKIDTFRFAFHFLSNLKIWIPMLFNFCSIFLHCLTLKDAGGVQKCPVVGRLFVISLMVMLWSQKFWLYP